MKLVIILNIIFCLALKINAFWWKSTPEEEVKRVPYHVIRTFSYQPVLLPSSPFAQQYQYGRGLIQPPNIPNSLQGSTQHYYPTSISPKLVASTTAIPTTKSTTRTTTTTTTTPASTAKTTTTEKPTTATWQEIQNRYGVESNNSPRLALKSSPFSDRYDYSSNLPSNINDYQQQTNLNRASKDPVNMQYITNISPMNVQFVPCMCPVEVRISNSDKQNEKESDDHYLESEYNNLDDKEDKSLKYRE